MLQKSRKVLSALLILSLATPVFASPGSTGGAIVAMQMIRRREIYRFNHLELSRALSDGRDVVKFPEVATAVEATLQLLPTEPTADQISIFENALYDDVFGERSNSADVRAVILEKSGLAKALADFSEVHKAGDYHDHLTDLLLNSELYIRSVKYTSPIVQNNLLKRVQRALFRTNQALEDAQLNKEEQAIFYTDFAFRLLLELNKNFMTETQSLLLAATEERAFAERLASAQKDQTMEAIVNGAFAVAFASGITSAVGLSLASTVYTVNPGFAALTVGAMFVGGLVSGGIISSRVVDASIASANSSLAAAQNAAHQLCGKMLTAPGESDFAPAKDPSQP